jgi:general stress protein 26
MSWLDRMTKVFAAWMRRFGERRHRDGALPVLRAARATMHRKTYCLLTTRGEDAPSARVLQPFPPSEDLEVWLGTSPKSRKVAEIERDPNATLVYQDDDRSACVVLVGTVEVVHAREERAKRFMPMWWAFFPEGPLGDDFVLLRFVPRRVEVWDISRGITPPPFGLRSSQITRSTEGWSLV